LYDIVDDFQFYSSLAGTESQIYLMGFAEKRRVAIAFAYLCSPHDRKTTFIDNHNCEIRSGH